MRMISVEAISQSHQYAPNCSVENPIHPLIEVHGRSWVRIPFGDLAGRGTPNSRGYFNPNATDNYIMNARQYASFFFRDRVRTWPLLILSWF